MKVAIIGASNKPERYSYLANKMLLQHGHEPYLVNPLIKTIDSQKVYPSIADIKDPIDTITLYVNPEISSKMKDEIINCNPARVILNPGSENQELQAELEKHNIVCEKACTLVLLSTDQFA